MTVAEHLDLIASVDDQFSDELGRLSGMLETIGGQADALDPIDIDVNVDDRELDELQGKLAATETADALEGTDSPRVPAGDGGGTTAATDGGGGFLDRHDIKNLEVEFGEAFSRKSLVNRGGEIMSPTQLLDGGLSDFIDVDEAVELSLSDDTDLDLNALSGLTGGDMDAFRKSLKKLQNLGLTDLPAEEKSMFKRLQDINLSMTQFYDILATLIPLLVVYIGALPAVITGLVALGAAAIGAAGGLAAIAGLGAIGFAMQQNGGGMPSMEDFADIMEDVRDRVFEALAPLAERLSPMFEKGLDGLDRFLNALADQGDVLLALRDDAEAFGGFLIDYAPTAIAKLGMLGDAASDVFGAIGQFLDGADITGALATELADMLPSLARFSALLIAALPGLLDFSEGLLDVAFLATAMFVGLGKLISAVLTLGGVLPVSDKFLGQLVGTLLMAITILGLGVKLTALFSGTLSGAFISSIATAITGLEAFSLAELQAMTATQLLTAAIRTLLITTGIGVFLTMAGEAMSLNNNIQSATKSLRKFGKVSGRMDGGGVGMTTGSSGVPRGSYINVTDNSQTTVNAPDKEAGVATANHLNYRKETGMDQYFSQ